MSTFPSDFGTICGASGPITPLTSCSYDRFDAGDTAGQLDFLLSRSRQFELLELPLDRRMTLDLSRPAGCSIKGQILDV